jgi:methyl-accepting chemotaxis protein
MKSSMPSAGPSQGPPHYKRSVKNYVIDARFQMKYTGMLVIVAVIISSVLVGFLWRTSNDVLRQGEQVAVQGRKAIEESRKVSDVVRMSMKDDPVYGQNPELLNGFATTSNEADKKFEEQQHVLVAQQSAIAQQQRSMMLSLMGGLAVMVLLIGMLGIYVTHKVAGPIYKMKMLLRQVGDGKLVFHGKLRRGDELQEFFETFATMVEKLRARQAREVVELEAAMKMAKVSGASDEAIARIELVHDEMKRAVDL